MSGDLERAFERAARHPSNPLDVSDLPGRARRLRLQRFVATGTVCALLITGAAFAASNWDRGPRPNTPVVAEKDDDCGSVDYDLIVFLRDDITDLELDSARHSIEEESAVVDGVEHFTKRDAYNEFKAFYRDQPEFWENLPRDALPQSFRVTLDEDASDEATRELIDRIEGLPGIDEVRTGEEMEGQNAEACLAKENGKDAPPWRVIDWPSTEIGAAVSCVDRYPEDLTDREIAFDGTITAVDYGEYDEGAGATPVTLQLYVNDVFRGDLDSQVTMHTWDFMLPDEDVTNVRMLAAAGLTFDLMGCGFSRPYSTEEAAEWRTAFAQRSVQRACRFPRFVPTKFPWDDVRGPRPDRNRMYANLVWTDATRRGPGSPYLRLARTSIEFGGRSNQEAPSLPDGTRGYLYRGEGDDTWAMQWEDGRGDGCHTEMQLVLPGMSAEEVRAAIVDVAESFERSDESWNELLVGPDESKDT